MVSPVSGSSTDLFSNFYDSHAFNENEMNQGIHNIGEAEKTQQEQWKNSQEQMKDTASK